MTTNAASTDQSAKGIPVRAAVVREQGAPFVIEKLILEEPRADEVLVRVVATGMCHADINHKAGPTRTPTPVVFGHEGAGVVERVGALVRKVVPGDHVVMSFLSCGRCPQCMRAQWPYCAIQNRLNFDCKREDGSSTLRDEAGLVHGSFFGQSSFATFSLANERNVVKVTKDVPLELLGPLGCGMQTGAGAVMNALKVGAGDSIAVFGAGSVGLAALMAARVVGATTIIAVDIAPSRLEMAMELGATHTIDSRAQDPIAEIRKIVAGGVDFAFDSTAVNAIFEQAVQTLAIKGTYGFVAGDPTTVGRKLDLRAFMTKGNRIMGIIQGDSVPDLFIPRLIELYQQGRFPFDKLVKFYPLDRINDAAEDSHHGTTIKPVIRMV